MPKEKNVDCMGARIEARLVELGWHRADLLISVAALRRGPADCWPLTEKTLGALIARNARSCEWSDEIAEALGVDHRWLQRGVGKKLREEDSGWPFGSYFAADDIRRLPDLERGRIVGYIERVLEGQPRRETITQAPPRASPCQIVHLDQFRRTTFQAKDSVSRSARQGAFFGLHSTSVESTDSTVVELYPSV